MILVKKVMVLVGFLTFGYFISYAQEGTTERDVVQKAKAATVIIVVSTSDGVLGNGSGFFIRKDLIATNIHVVAGIYGKPITCSAKLVDQSIEYNIKGVMASDPEHDLVILKVDRESKNVLPIGDSDAVSVGEEVIAIGTHDNNLPGKIVKGTISRTTPLFFRMKGTLSPGYSGGPLLNNQGTVVGVCVEGGLIKKHGYIVPSNHLRKLLQDMPAEEIPLEKWREERFITAYTIVKLGDEKLKVGDFKGALEAYNNAIHLKPDFAFAYAKRGMIHNQLGNYKSSIIDYDAVICLKMDYPGAYVNRGVAKRLIQNYRGAIKDYDIAIKLDPESTEAYLNRGNVHKVYGEYKKAIDDYNTVIHLKPENTILAVAYLRRANTKSDMSDYVKAIEDYSETIRLSSNNTTLLIVAHLNRGVAKFKLGDARGAIEDYDEVIRLRPQKSMLSENYGHRATAKSMLNDHAGAIKDYSSAIRLSTGNTKGTAHIYAKRAAEKLSINDNKGAIEDSDTAIGLDPILSEAYKIRGDAKYNLQNYTEAIKDYDKAIYMKPTYFKAYYQRGKAKVKIGKVSDAKIDFRTALKFAKSQNSQSIKDEIQDALTSIK